MGGGILPVAKHKGKIYFLFGLEEYDKKWSDFGGSKENNETSYQTAIREGYEEFDGFLGNMTTLKKLVSKNLLFKLKLAKYTTFLFEMPYNETLPHFFNIHHTFIKSNMPKIVNKKGYFEKSVIKWMSFEEIKQNKNKFRPFYQEMIKLILLNENIINKSI